VGIYSFPDRENEMNNLVSQKYMGNSRILFILALIAAVFSILSTVLIVRISLILTFDRNERRAREFVEIVVDSINQQTEYYKHHCSKDALAEIEGSINEITDKYKITVITAEQSYYEYDLTFDGKNKFTVDVEHWPQRDLEIIHFMSIPKKVDR
jgi:archaellum biogenesis ATPase FlaH